MSRNCRWHEASRQVLGTLLAQLFFQLCDALGHRRLLLILNQKLVDLIMLHTLYPFAGSVRAGDVCIHEHELL